MTAMLPEDVLGDPKVWDSLLRRIAERVSRQVLAELSVRVGEHLEDDLVSAAARMSKILAEELQPIQKEIARAHAVLEALAGQQAKMESVLGQFSPAMEAAVAGALALMDREIRSRRETLAMIAAGEGATLANALSASLLQQAANDASMLYWGLDSEVTRLSETQRTFTTLLGHRSIRQMLWFGETPPDLRDAMRAHAEILASFVQNALPLASQLAHEIQRLWASVEPLAAPATE